MHKVFTSLRNYWGETKIHYRKTNGNNKTNFPIWGWIGVELIGFHIPYVEIDKGENNLVDARDNI